MATGHDAGRPVILQPAHRSQPGLHSAVVGLTPGVLVLTGVVERRWDKLIDHVRQGRSAIGDDLRRAAMRPQRHGEEPSHRGAISVLGDEHVNGRAVLVDGPVDVAPDAVDLHSGFTNEPAVTHGMSARADRIDQLRREALHPPEQLHVIHVDTALGKELAWSR